MRSTGELAPIRELIGDGLFVDGDWIESKDQDPNGDVRLIQLADIGDGAFRDRSNRFLTAQKAKDLRCTFLSQGDVLVARMPDPLGRACIFPGVDQPAVTAVDVCIIRTSDVDPKWLMWMLNAPQSRRSVASLQSGTTRKRISRKNLATVGLPVHSRFQQEEIVEEIEKQFTRLDAAVASLLRVRVNLRRMNGAVVRSLMKFEESGWTTLGEIADITGGVTKDSKRQSDPRYVEVPYLRVANVQRGFLDLSEIKTIRVPPETAEGLKLRPGDILFNEGGDRDKLGRGWIWEGQIPGCIHQNHVFRARLLTTEFSPKFISIHGNTFGQQWFDKMGKQTTNLASLNMTTLRQFPTPAPPLPDQEHIVAVMERRFSVIDQLEQDVEAGIKRADRLRYSILASAFAGQLV